ncbi:MAG: DNA polymerase I [Candidatus Magasanikbacteria bacterium]|nr:DNA polymerase I [Candidatus Magasanikbacteria bacterium]
MNVNAKKEIFVIIDGNAIIHRAYHALPPLTAKDGSPINAVYGFTAMLLKVLNEIKPNYLAVSFDVDGGTFRDDLYKDYKATRVRADQDLYDQIPLTYQIVQAFQIPIYTKQGYEADDVIGTVARKIKNQKNRKITCVIVSGDKDMLQLADDGHTEVYLLKKGISEYELYDENAVTKRFGFGPEHIVDFKALMGDSSDNIPGIAGIGTKTATELIEKIGGIEEIYKHIKKLEDFKIKKSVIDKLNQGKKDALLSQRLARIKTDVGGITFSLKNCRVSPYDSKEVKDILKKFEFYSLLTRLPNAGSSTLLKKDAKNKVKAGLQEKETKMQTWSADRAAELAAILEKQAFFYCKEILTGPDIFQSKLRGLVFGTGKESWFLELFWDSRSGTRKYQAHSDVESIFKKNKDRILLGHDLKQLIKALNMYDIEPELGLFDVMVASYIINSSARTHDLPSIALRELGLELAEKVGQGNLFGLDSSTLAGYGEHIFKIKEAQTKRLEKDDNLGLFSQLEMPLISVLARMELNGIAVDSAVLNVLSSEAHENIKALTKKIWKEAGQEFNIASSVQLREILFEKMDLPTQNIKKGKTGYSTASSELEKLREESPIITLIEEYRELSKLQNTYTDVLPGLVNKVSGRIHSTFNQTVASTGRLSSSDPNLQNIPIRTELGKKIRDAFVAEPGNLLLAADYSQIELRIVASLAEDKKMLDIFERGEDIHTATAAAINGVSPEQVTKQMRYAAKEVNFGVLYGMGVYGLSWRAGIPQWQAKEFIDKYFEEFSGVKAYIDDTLETAKKTGYVETLFGRRRYIPELRANNYQLRSAAERMAVNMPIQGTAADVMKMAMIAVDTSIKRNFGKEQGKEIRMILQVHDELVLEVKKGREKALAELLKKEMEEVVELRVPIEVHVSIGERWGDLK